MIVRLWEWDVARDAQGASVGLSDTRHGAMEALSEGWWPLRWCLSVTPTVTYAGGEVGIDLTLANEDVLSPGTYPVKVVMLGPDGRRWGLLGTVSGRFGG